MIWTCGVALCSTAKKQLVPLSDWKGMLRYSDHVVGEAIEMYRRDCAMGLEGIVCKRASAPYRQGRSNAWVKVKCRNREEFVVSGERHYVGGVGAGFNPHELSVLRAQLDRIPGTAPRRVWYAGDPLHRMIRWVRPELVVEVEYAGWSRSGRLGQPVFLGILEDKSPEEVVREIADPRAARIAVTSHSGGVSRNG
jgi:bifunctional non-homologous end joining protein LigD